MIWMFLRINELHVYLCWLNEFCLFQWPTHQLKPSVVQTPLSVWVHPQGVDLVSSPASPPRTLELVLATVPGASPSPRGSTLTSPSWILLLDLPSPGLPQDSVPNQGPVEATFAACMLWSKRRVESGQTSQFAEGSSDRDSCTPRREISWMWHCWPMLTQHISCWSTKVRIKPIHPKPHSSLHWVPFTHWPQSV